MHSQLPDPIFKRIHQCGVIAVLVIEDARHAVPLARALIEGGVQAMELTLRTPAALEALRLVKAEVPEMLAGVGTVITPEQVADIVRLKADFAVAPGTSPRVIAAARAHGLPFVPGVATPSDISTAVELGCRELKFFPAEPSGGIPYLKSMAAPFAHLGLGFIPLGGVSVANLKNYLQTPSILAVGGSWLAPNHLIQDEAWDKIRALALEARSVVDSARGQSGGN